MGKIELENNEEDLRWIETFLEDREMKTVIRVYGFRHERSCVTNLLSFYLRLMNITQERDGWVKCLDLDLKSTLDKVPLTRLI